MSKQSRMIKKIKRLKHEWKLIDDYSGFEIYASDAIVNPEYGVITHVKEFDPPFWDALETHLPEEYFPPHFRIQTVPSNGYQGIDYNTVLTYDIDFTDINLNFTNMEITRYAPFNDDDVSDVNTDIL